MKKFKRPKTAAEIAEIIGGRVIGDESVEIDSLNRIENAESRDLTFCGDYKYEKYIAKGSARCIIVENDFDVAKYPEKTFVTAENPYLAFIKLIRIVDSEQAEVEPAIESSAIISETARVAAGVRLGAGVVVGEYCVIAENVSVSHGTVIDNNCEIGEGTVIGSNVSICCDTIIGKNCLILPGAVIGSDGFGFVELSDKSYDRIPQIGNVVIEDDVEIGANSTIDRAMVGSTIIRKGVKIDNLCHVAHNVEIGEHTGIAAQTGISGSAKVGDRNRFGGQVGLAGHLQTAADVVLYAKSGVPKTISKPGVYFGYPARELKKALVIEAVMRGLPETDKKISKLIKYFKEKFDLDL